MDAPCSRVAGRFPILPRTYRSCEQVAIKRMVGYYADWEACLDLPEVKARCRLARCMVVRAVPSCSPCTLALPANRRPCAMHMVQVLQALHHPHLIELLRVVRQDGILFLVYECMDRSLLDYLDKVKLPQRTNDDTRSFTYVVRSIRHAHHAGQSR